MMDFPIDRFIEKKCRWCEYRPNKSNGERSINGTFINHIYNKHKQKVLEESGETFLSAMKKALDKEVN